MKKMKSSSAKATEDKVKKIILGLVIVLGLSFCAVFSVMATDENCPFPSVIHQGMDINQGSDDGWLKTQQGMDQNSEGWLGIQQGVQAQQMPRYPQYQEPSQYQGTEDWLDISGGNLSYGMRSDNVMNLQQRLSQDPSIYPEGLTTGYFGELTKRAVERFQEKQGLQQTGIVDSFLKQSIWDTELRPTGLLIGCDGECRIKGYDRGICRTCAIYPGEKPCKEGEVSIGDTSDCSVAPGLVGVQKACCCGEKQTGICTSDEDCKILKCPGAYCANGQCICPQIQGNCTDTDGGINKYVKGTTCQPSKSSIIDSSGKIKLFCKTDKCMVVKTPGGGTYLQEYYCENTRMMSKQIRCENGCKNGACLSANKKLMEGDADLNGCVSLADAELIQTYLVGLTVGSKTLTADTNDDGVISLKDSTMIKMWLEDSTYPLWQSPEDDDMAKPVVCGAIIDCVGDGEVLYTLGTVKGECCAGLHEISSGYRNGVAYCTSETCGNGSCRALENKHNCSEDCKTTIQQVDVQPTTDVQPIIDMIREVIEKLNSAIRLLGNLI